MITDTSNHKSTDQSAVLLISAHFTFDPSGIGIWDINSFWHAATTIRVITKTLLEGVSRRIPEIQTMQERRTLRSTGEEEVGTEHFSYFLRFPPNSAK